MGEEVEVRDLPSAIDFQYTEGTISADNLTFAYNESQKVLNDISFKVSSGETIALVRRAFLVEGDDII